MTAGPFFEQFIDDYYAECDEHLAVVRRALLSIEEQGSLTDTADRRQMLRSLHTLKGLSGMVGLVEAERVAHAMEELVRATGEDGAAEPRLVEALFAGARLLEQCVGARRAGRVVPDVGGYLATVEPLGATPAVATPAGATQPGVTQPAADDAPADGAARRGVDGQAVVYRFEFSPSAELAARGVGVETVRSRLQSLGTLVAARPRVIPGSGITFEFEVEVPPGTVPDERWRADRMTWVADAPAGQSVATLSAPGAAPAGAPAGASTANGVALSVRGAPPSPPEPAGGAPLSGALSFDAAHVPFAGSNSVRVDLTRLDEIMRMVGELVVSRSRLEDSLRRAGDGTDADGEALREASTAIERQLRALREGVMRIRLVPVGETFERVRFAVRDIAQASRKLVTLELAGQSTEIDKLVVDRMLEPLLHLVRNAVSHGIEPPEDRRALGKPTAGRLALRAAAAGDRIVIEVEDDGAGIDIEYVAERAREAGLLAPDEDLRADHLLDVLCAPGFSTRAEADLASGRGIGMSVVRDAIRSLGGELALFTEPGRGTRFVAELPLTLMIVDALLVEIGPHLMAVPQPALREILRVDASEPTLFESNAVISYRGGILPLMSLRRQFGLHDELGERDPLYVLVVGADAHQTGLLVDRIVGLREIVVHPVTDPLVAMPGIGGATELGDGSVCLIIDAGALLRLSHERRDARAPRPLLAAGASRDDRG